MSSQEQCYVCPDFKAAQMDHNWLHGENNNPCCDRKSYLVFMHVHLPNRVAAVYKCGNCEKIYELDPVSLDDLCDSCFKTCCADYFSALSTILECEKFDEQLKK